MRKIIGLIALFLTVFIAQFAFPAQYAKDLRVQNPLLLQETAVTATATVGYGTVYTKASDKALYFRDSANNEFNVLLGVGASIGLDYLSDVDVTTASPTLGQALVYDGSIWKAGNVSSTLSSLSDVDTTGVISGNVLGYDGAKWVPSTGGKTLIGVAPLNVTQNASTATFSVVQDTNNRFVTDTEKGIWNGKQDTITASGPLFKNINNLYMTQSGSVTGGYLTATDWNTFNNKITTPATCGVNQHVSFDGSNYVCVDASISAGQSSNYFFVDTPSGVSTYETLSRTASTAVEELDSLNLVVNNTEVLSAVYADGAIGSTSIEAGLWEIDFYRLVNSTSGTTELILRFYSRTTGGVETELFNITTGDINDTTGTLQVLRTTQPAFTVSPSDVLVVKIFGKTTSQPKTVTFIHNGTSRNSLIRTPIITRHNQLAGLNQAGGNYQHLTDAQFSSYITNATPLTATQSALLYAGVETATLTSYTKTGTLTNISATSTIARAIGAIVNTLSGTATYATDWAAYTPVFIGFGTVSTQSFMWRKEGSNVQIMGYFVSGSTTAAEPRISLPVVSSATLTTSSSLPTISSRGLYFRNSNGGDAASKGGGLILEPSKQYFVIGRHDLFGSANANWGNKITSSAASFSSGDVFTIDVTIPIQGWDSIVRAPIVDLAVDTFRYEGYTSNASTNTRQSVWTTSRESPSNGYITVSNSSTSGFSVTANTTGVFQGCFFPAATACYVGWSKNSNQLSTDFDTITRSTVPCGRTFSNGGSNTFMFCCTTKMAVNDVMRVHMASACSFSSNDAAQVFGSFTRTSN